jgi:hypothetical protein
LIAKNTCYFGDRTLGFRFAPPWASEVYYASGGSTVLVHLATYH